MLAELVRFYALDPERIMTMPAFLLAGLIRQMPAIQAGQQLASIQAATLPHVGEKGRTQVQRVIRNLERQAMRGLDQPTVRPKVEVIEHNPEKAREWALERGIKVQNG